MSVKSVLVTGVDRMAGRQVVATLVSKAYRVLALTPETLPRDAGLVQYVQGDITNLPEWEERLEGIDLIVHCANHESYLKRDRKHLVNYNVLATRDLVDAALSFGVSHMIYIGSAFSLARSADPLLLAADASGNPVFHSHFARTIFHAELEIWRAEAEGMQVCILHPARLIDLKSGERDLPLGVKIRNEHARAGIKGLLTTDDLGNWVTCTLDRSLWSERFLICSDLELPERKSGLVKNPAVEFERIHDRDAPHPLKGSNWFDRLTYRLAARWDDCFGNEWKAFNALNFSYRSTERERELCLISHSGGRENSFLAG